MLDALLFALALALIAGLATASLLLFLGEPLFEAVRTSALAVAIVFGTVLVVFAMERARADEVPASHFPSRARG